MTEEEMSRYTAMERLRRYDATVFDPVDGMYRIWDGRLIIEGAPNPERSVATDGQSENSAPAT